ncbi:2-hydroxychromene-2-carboxylate isomerase [Chondromyces apiculatus]|uniref:2-hydroxychromene-2-carboxylate isomerase n=1 Tax=Chondromyces apiculatus DSM 436 TaxID=1192034 RepID=A0A017SX58_9BACT|nr:2-hydroxychromene-2-carboxylate isomerase [Chondromyces apiculatus]EYF01367.1 2-hydroxychromene-2-carboxylate isomerase [Chondromyces apiculatus DSM 436]
MKHVDFWFDVSSPFAYLGAAQIDALAARHDATVSYRPFFLGALFKRIGTPEVPLFAASAPKQRYYYADLHRWADHIGVPFRFPTRFPMLSIKPLRMLISLPDAERPRLAHPLFRAYWAEDRDISDDKTLADIATSAGFDPAPLLSATTDDQIKTKLRDATEEAVQAGICGAPTFIVNGLLFWGQDRLLFVEKALNGWVSATEREA